MGQNILSGPFPLKPLPSSPDSLTCHCRPSGLDVMHALAWWWHCIQVRWCYGGFVCAGTSTTHPTTSRHPASTSSNPHNHSIRVLLPGTKGHHPGTKGRHLGSKGRHPGSKGHHPGNLFSAHLQGKAWTQDTPRALCPCMLENRFNFCCYFICVLGSFVSDFICASEVYRFTQQPRYPG